LEIKKIVVFGKGNSFRVENQSHRATVTCNDWLEPGSGVAILIGTIDK